MRLKRYISGTGGWRRSRCPAVVLRIPCDGVLSTVALPLLSLCAPDLEPAYRKGLEAIEYLGVVCCLLVLKRPLTGVFWVNINDRRIPFNGVIEYTNLNPVPGLGGRTVAYIPHYLRTTHPRFGFDDDTLRAESVAGLKLVNPEFDESWIDDFVVSRSLNAQAICTVGFSDWCRRTSPRWRGCW